MFNKKKEESYDDIFKDLSNSNNANNLNTKSQEESFQKLNSNEHWIEASNKASQSTNLPQLQNTQSSSEFLNQGNSSLNTPTPGFGENNNLTQKNSNDHFHNSLVASAFQEHQSYNNDLLIIKKDIELILEKLNTLKIILDSLDARVKRLEEIAQKSQNYGSY